MRLGVFFRKSQNPSGRQSVKEELKAFCELQNKMEYYSWLDDEQWTIYLANLCDIFEQLNKLNLQMQSRNSNVIKFVDALKAFKAKLEEKNQNRKLCNV